MLTRPSPWRRMTVLVAMGLLPACASLRSASDGTAILRAAVDTPEQFLVATAAGTEAPRPDGTCRNPLGDPRTGAPLALVRSRANRGDYEPRAAAAAYGVRRGELLRIECGTGRALGIVRR